MRQKKVFNRRLGTIGGLERFSVGPRFQLYRKQVQLFSDHLPLKPQQLENNETNQQYSARLTRWLDQSNHFDFVLKNTARKKMKFTDFINRNPTENAEPAENYQEEFSLTPSCILQR